MKRLKPTDIEARCFNIKMTSFDLKTILREKIVANGKIEPQYPVDLSEFNQALNVYHLFL